MQPFPAAAAPDSARRPARILVVEDERVVALGLQVQLEGMGHEVPALAASGEEALRLMEVDRPDLVLMDINLDGAMDGVEAAAAVRDRFRVPVVFLTAYSNEELVARAKRAEPYGYVLKPYEDRELAIVIEMALYRARVRRQLEEQRHLVEATLRSVADGVVATDPGGRVTLLNAAGERLTGWSDEMARGRPVEEVVRLERGAVPLARAMRERAVIALPPTACLVSRARGAVPIESTAAPIVDDEGRLLGGVMTFRDVGGRREAARAAAQLAAIVASSEDAIIATSPEGVITSWNGGAERLYGHAEGEAVGQPLSLLVPADRQQELLNDLAQAIQGQRVAGYETVRRRKDGSRVEVVVSMSPYRDGEGQVAGAAMISRAVPGRREAGGAAPAAARSGGETVLLVEDEKAVRRMTEHLLRREGYAVLSAESGTAALALARSHPGPIHLLLTDVRLPDLDGPALAVAVRAERPEVRVVFQTGYAPPEVLSRVPGGGLLLQKPFTLDQLAARVREALA